jgi:hypothetical protein
MAAIRLRLRALAEAHAPLTMIAHTDHAAMGVEADGMGRLGALDREAVQRVAEHTTYLDAARDDMAVLERASHVAAVTYVQAMKVVRCGALESEVRLLHEVVQV